MKGGKYDEVNIAQAGFFMRICVGTIGAAHPVLMNHCKPRLIIEAIDKKLY